MSDKLKHIKQTGFTTPDNYFNNLEDRVFEKMNVKSDLDSIINSGFNVPQDYFSTVEDSVFNKLNVEKEEVKVVPLFSKRNLLYFSGIAASVILMLSIFIKETDTISEELDYDLVAEYIMEQNVNSYEIASLLTTEELNTIDGEIMLDAFSNDDMELYLIDNANLEDIIEQ